MNQKRILIATLRGYLFSSNQDKINQKLRLSNTFSNEDVYESFNQGIYRQELKRKVRKNQLVGSLKQFGAAANMKP